MQVMESLPEGSDASWEGQWFEKETCLKGLVLSLACTGRSWQDYMKVHSIFPIFQMGRTIRYFAKLIDTNGKMLYMLT